MGTCHIRFPALCAGCILLAFRSELFSRFSVCIIYDGLKVIKTHLKAIFVFFVFPLFHSYCAPCLASMPSVSLSWFTIQLFLHVWPKPTSLYRRHLNICLPWTSSCTIRASFIHFPSLPKHWIG